MTSPSASFDQAPGIRFNDQGEAHVKMWAPEAKEAAIKLVNQNTQFPLVKANFGFWKLKTEKIKPGDRYKFVLDKKKELPDPASLAQPEGVHGASEAIDLSGFSWTDGHWENIPLEAYLLYELHIGTFSPQGTFSGLAEKLDYLKALGITAIEIMPVAQFPGSRNWGYDGVYPFAVQHSYGGARGLQQLVNACHEKGLAVILDVVYNHLGPEGNYMGAFGPYFTDKYHTPWGQAINFDDAWSDNVRHYFIENVLMWFRDFHIDALRLDAVHAIKDLGPNHVLREMKQQTNALMEATGRRHYLIAEVDLNDVRFIKPLEKCGYGMDAQWADEFHHALRVASGNTKTGYYIEYDGLTHLAKAYRDAYVFDGLYSVHRKKTFGSKTTDIPGKRFIVFSQNHDQVGNRALGERTCHLVSFEMQKLLAGAVMASPYLPMLFMGEEFSASSPFLYFVSHSDPELVEAVRKGRKAEFADLHAKIEAPDPQSEATFQKSKLPWGDLEAEQHQMILGYYKTLIALRKQQPALKHLNREQLDTEENELQQTLMLHRWHEKHHVVCFMNFSSEQQTTKVPAHAQTWHKWLDSAAPEWNGPASAPESIEAGATLQLQPASFLIYSNQQNRYV